MPKFGRMTADEAMSILNYRESVKRRNMQEQQHASDAEAKKASIEQSRAATRAHMANPDYIQSVNTARGILNQSGMEYDDTLDAAQNLNNLVKNTPVDKRTQIINGISSAFKKPEKKSVGDIEAEVLQQRLAGREKFGSPRVEDVNTYNSAMATEKDIVNRALGTGKQPAVKQYVDKETGDIFGLDSQGNEVFRNPAAKTPAPDIMSQFGQGVPQTPSQPVTQSAPSRYDELTKRKQQFKQGYSE